MLGENLVRVEVAVEGDAAFEKRQALKKYIGIRVVRVVVAPEEQPLLRLALACLHKLENDLDVIFGQGD